MKVNLVCEGGGVRGIAHIGAICALEDNGFTFNAFAGTSAGALITSLLAVGYSGYELKEILFNLDFSLYTNKTILASIPIIGEQLSLFKSKGIFSTNTIEEVLIKLYSNKNKRYIKDICSNNLNYWRCIATDITQKQMLVLPEDLKKYDIDVMNFEISKVVKMSISIPLVFIPEKLKTSKGTCYIVDGGLTSNLPIWLFNDSSYTTFALKLISNNEGNIIYADKCPLSKYILDVVDGCMSKNEAMYFNSQSNIQTIKIPTFNIGITDFYLSKKDKKMLFDSGYNSTNNFIKSLTQSKFKAVK